VRRIRSWSIWSSVQDFLHLYWTKCNIISWNLIPESEHKSWIGSGGHMLVYICVSIFAYTWCHTRIYNMFYASYHRVLLCEYVYLLCESVSMWTKHGEPKKTKNRWALLSYWSDCLLPTRARSYVQHTATHCICATHCNTLCVKL